MEITTLFLAGSLAIIPALTPATAEAPDLCADVYLAADGSPIHDSTGRTLSRYCQWTGPDAPRFDDEVCCALDTTGAACGLPDTRGQCEFGEPYWCEFGEVDSLGGVVCYQPLPDACEAGYCVEAPAGTPPGEAFESMCCGPGGCFHMEHIYDDCDGEYAVCWWGISNADGTVECFD